MQIFSYLLFTVFAVAVRASASMSYYSDSSCSGLVRYESHFTFDSCVKVDESSPRRIFFMKLDLPYGDDRTVKALSFPQENCRGPGAYEFDVTPGECVAVNAETIRVKSPEPFYPFHYYETPDCTGIPTVLDVRDSQKYFNFTCFDGKDPSIKGIQGIEYADIEMLTYRCGTGDRSYPHVNLNGGACFQLKNSSDSGDYVHSGYQFAKRT